MVVSLAELDVAGRAPLLVVPLGGEVEVELDIDKVYEGEDEFVYTAEELK